MRPRLFDPRYLVNSFSFQIDSVASVKWRKRDLFNPHTPDEAIICSVDAAI